MGDKYWARHSRHVDNIQVDHLVTSMGLAATQSTQQTQVSLWERKGTVRKYCLGQRDLG